MIPEFSRYLDICIPVLFLLYREFHLFAAACIRPLIMTFSVFVTDKRALGVSYFYRLIIVPPFEVDIIDQIISIFVLTADIVMSQLNCNILIVSLQKVFVATIV